MSIGTQNHSNQQVYDTGLHNNAHVTPAAINQAAEEQLAAAAALAEQTYRPLVEAAANGGNASTPPAPTPEPQELSQQSTPPRTPPPRQHQELIATSPHVSTVEDASVDEDNELVESAFADNKSVESVEDDNDSIYEDSNQTTAVEESARVDRGNGEYYAAWCAESVDDDEDKAGETLGAELIADTEDGLNAVEDGDIAADYGAVESGDDAEKDDVESNEDDDSSAEFYGPDDEDEDEQSESKTAAEVLFAENFLDRFGGEDKLMACSLKNDVLRSMSATGWESVEIPDTEDSMQAPYEPVNNNRSYPGLRQGYSGPTAEALRNADSPLALFFFFLPVVLWQQIAVCSNQYHREMLPLRVEERYKRYRPTRLHKPELPRKTRRDFRHELEGMKTIRPHELCRFVGLLIARTIAPTARSWQTTGDSLMKVLFQVVRSAPACDVIGSWRFKKISISIQTMAHAHRQTEPGRYEKWWRFCRRRLLVDTLRLHTWHLTRPSFLASRLSTRCGSI
ncbi:unnamed protein product [Phytophthora fragariaefolia]|uniref:Unnamed protein product n=1 Tax=Phytophthora fragariaefolia TaxID=1490495 RepID=A0A9W7D2X4_9STRA|nr:unnamed protein product [Phytophthora fragariaefolia]